MSTVELKLEARSATLARSSRGALLSMLDERRLVRRWRVLGDAQALERLVRSHMGLVKRIALEFRHADPSLDDIIQEGTLGLIIAAQRFDPGRNTRLATYATYWIRACILDYAMRNHGPVRIGTTRNERKIFFGLGRARRRLAGQGGAPDDGRLAATLGVTRVDIEAMSARLSSRDLSLDAARPGADGRPPLQVPAGADSPEDVVAARERDRLRRAALQAGLAQLDPREREIIRARHLCARPATLGQLASRFMVSRERIRQLDARARAKLTAFVQKAV